MALIIRSRIEINQENPSSGLVPLSYIAAVCDVMGLMPEPQTCNTAGALVLKLPITPYMVRSFTGEYRKSAISPCPCSGHKTGKEVHQFLNCKKFHNSHNCSQNISQNCTRNNARSPGRTLAIKIQTDTLHEDTSTRCYKNSSITP
jgi:hypothetical protein